MIEGAEFGPVGVAQKPTLITVPGVNWALEAAGVMR